MHRRNYKSKTIRRSTQSETPADLHLCSSRRVQIIVVVAMPSVRSPSSFSMHGFIMPACTNDDAIPSESQRSDPRPRPEFNRLMETFLSLGSDLLPVAEQPEDARTANTVVINSIRGSYEGRGLWQLSGCTYVEDLPMNVLGGPWFRSSFPHCPPISRTIGRWSHATRPDPF